MSNRLSFILIALFSLTLTASAAEITVLADEGAKVSLVGKADGNCSKISATKIVCKGIVKKFGTKKIVDGKAKFIVGDNIVYSFCGFLSNTQNKYDKCSNKGFGKIKLDLR
jgi:hypothetical protein